MSYTVRKEQNVRDIEFLKLSANKNRLVEQVTDWVHRATLLHTSTTDPAEQAEVIALRDELVAELRVPLGV